MSAAMKRLSQVANSLHESGSRSAFESSVDLVTLMRQVALAACAMPGNGRSMARIMSPIAESFRGASVFASDADALEYAIRILQRELEEIRLRKEAADRGVSVESLILAPLMESGVPVTIIVDRDKEG